MKADRLISIIMLLESQGNMTAKELASELEVTQRTIYRDIDALCGAGIPIYGSTGHEGGYRVIEGYKSGLNGLNRDEVLALLSLSVSEQLDEIGLGAKLKSTILKIRSKYNNYGNADTALRVYIDSKGWREGSRPTSQLSTLYNCVSNSKVITITYNLQEFPSNEFVRVINPYGLVIKQNIWYLVYLSNDKLWVINTKNIKSIEGPNESFSYPRDFNLEEFWKNWCNEVSKQFTNYCVKAFVPEELKSEIYAYIRDAGFPFTTFPLDYGKVKWCEVELYFDTFEEARSKLLSLGGAVKVIEPIALRYSIMDYAEQIRILYR